MTLLAWVDREAVAAVRTEPGHAVDARKHLERSLMLASNRDVFPVRIVTPRDLEAEPLDDGRLLPRWQPSPGAGFHMILVHATAPSLPDSLELQPGPEHIRR